MGFRKSQGGKKDVEWRQTELSVLKRNGVGKGLTELACYGDNREEEGKVRDRSVGTTWTKLKWQIPKNSFKTTPRAKELGQQLKVHSVLIGHSGSLLSTQGSSQLSTTPVPGDRTPSPGLYMYCTHMVHRHTYKKNIHMHTIKKNLK